MRVRLGPFQGDGADFGKRRFVIKALQPLQGGFANRTPAFSRRCSGLARRRQLRGGRPFSPRPSPGPAEQSNGKDPPERRRPARRSPPRRGAGCSECGGAASRRPRGRGAEGRPSLPQGRFQREGAGAPAAKGPEAKRTPSPSPCPSPCPSPSPSPSPSPTSRKGCCIAAPHVFNRLRLRLRLRLRALRPLPSSRRAHQTIVEQASMNFGLSEGKAWRIPRSLLFAMTSHPVMAGLVPAIHAAPLQFPDSLGDWALSSETDSDATVFTWMAGSSPAMTDGEGWAAKKLVEDPPRPRPARRRFTDRSKQC